MEWGRLIRGDALRVFAYNDALDLVTRDNAERV